MTQRELYRHKLPTKEYVPPTTALKVFFADKCVVSTNTGDSSWVFDEVVIVETEFEGRRSLGVLMLEPFNATE